ncbi:MAG: hypothetical protein DHS20C18_10620 [Saprospiraceae bacterium]|nr:MAG: hypothetical protein DHS20C18_10620 [Saprospiraceae bacterium]
MKIVLDTNVFIACIGKASPYRWTFNGIIDGRFTLCISNEILIEYQEILCRKTTPEIAENVINFSLFILLFITQKFSTLGI